MQRPTQRTISTWLLVVQILLAIAFAGAVMLGVMRADAPWAPASLAAGGLGIVAMGLAIAVRSWAVTIYGAAFVVGVGLVITGLIDSIAMFAPGVLVLVIVAVSVPIYAAVRSSSPAAAATTGISPGIRDLLDQIQQHSMLSDSAKRVLFREHELGLLREAIEEDIRAGKYNVALTLCDEMANVFGYREEAEAFRARILDARQERYDVEVRAALQNLDHLLVNRSWAEVHQEAARIRRLYGDSHQVHDLDQRIRQSREEHKRELEQQFLNAAERDDVEAAMGMLKELDRYLDPQEAERLTGVAQGVVVKHRDNLGVQFKLAVNDHRWSEAAQIGEAIMAEFPNTQMAEEVRSMIDVLRTRATQAAMAGGESR